MVVDSRKNQGGKRIHYSNVYIFIFCFRFSSAIFSLTFDLYLCVVFPCTPTRSFRFIRVVYQILRPTLVQIAAECLQKCVARFELHFHFVTNPSEVIALVGGVPVATYCCDSSVVVDVAAM